MRNSVANRFLLIFSGFLDYPTQLYTYRKTNIVLCHLYD